MKRSSAVVVLDKYHRNQQLRGGYTIKFKCTSSIRMFLRGFTVDRFLTFACVKNEITRTRAYKL